MPTGQGGGEKGKRGVGEQSESASRETEKPEASGVMKARENFQEGRFL